MHRCLSRTIMRSGLLFLLIASSLETRAQEPKNPAPGDPYPEDFVYDVSGGGQFRLADFKGKKAVLITNHIVDDGPVSCHSDPFKRLKQLQAKYQDRLAIAVMPEYAHNRQQHRQLWETAANDVRELMNPGNLPILIENKGTGGVRAGKADHSLYRALNPENLHGWWPMVLIDKEGRIAWTSMNPLTGFAEHNIYETELHKAVVQLVDPEGYQKWLAEVPHDWVRQESPWGTLEIEDFERYRDMGDLHVSPCWSNNPPTTYKGELSLFPARTGYRALAVFHSQATGFAFGYPFYYGYRDPGYGIWAHHLFEGPPRTGTLTFFFAAFLRVAKTNYSVRKGRGFALQLEGTDGQEVFLRFGRIGQHPPKGPEDVIAGDIQTDVRWDINEAWNRISFHVDPARGTQIFLGTQLLAHVPKIKGITGILFQAGWACSVDDVIMIPQNVSVDELGSVIRWVDEHALERPYVTPLERECEIGRLDAQKKQYAPTLRVNWGSSKSHTDSEGLRWQAGQPWMRGTFGSLSGDDFVYPPEVQIVGSDSEIYRTVRYSAARLRFTVPKGFYTLRVHFARPSHWKAIGEFPEDLVQMELEPDGPNRCPWDVRVPYRKAAVFEKAGIRVEDGVLDLRFIFNSQVHVAATELVQESVESGQVVGIPDWQSVAEEQF